MKEQIIAALVEKVVEVATDLVNEEGGHQQGKPKRDPAKEIFFGEYVLIETPQALFFGILDNCSPRGLLLRDARRLGVNEDLRDNLPDQRRSTEWMSRNGLTEVYRASDMVDRMLVSSDEYFMVQCSENSIQSILRLDGN